VGRFEVYPNRDSVAYVGKYGIEGVRTMFRGTLRYPGWCETLDALARLGLLDDVSRGWRAGTTHEEFMEAFAGAETVSAAVMDRLRFAGLYSDRPLGAIQSAPIDVLCARLAASLTYGEGERDMIVLQHELGVVTASGKSETRTSTLVAFGQPGGDSAMARTVALPATVAARLILDGRIAATGVRIPIERDIYDPVLDALEPMGIAFRETRSAP
jgi:saccharopine dehydrogenase-like NADP-dependent oxidoreductase